MIRLLFLITFLLIYCSVSAQEISSKDSIIIYSSSGNTSRLSFSEMEYQSLDGFQRYRKLQQNVPYAHMGNNGLPFHTFFYKKSSLGVYEAAPASSMYFWNKNTIKYYHTNRPFTELQYLIGAEEESYLKLFHTQNFGKNLNIALQYHRVNSNGLYSRQLATQALFNTSINFQSADSTYRARAFFTYNNVDHYENGGIFVPDSIDPNSINSDLLPVNLRNAEAITKNHGYFLNQSFDLLKLLGSSKKDIINLVHEFYYQKVYRRYTDNTTQDEGFYDKFYLNDNGSYDSTYIRDYYNTVGISFFSGLFSLNLKSRDVNVFQNFLISEDLHTNYLLVKSTKTFNKFKYSYSFQKGLSGYYIKGLNSSLGMEYQLNRHSSIFAFLEYDQYRPDVLVNKYRTNHIRYDTNFVGVKNIHPEVTYKSSKYKTNVTLGVNNTRDYIYFDTSAIPLQYSEELINVFLRLSHKLSFLGKMNFNNEILYQYVNNHNVLSLPEYATSHSLFYENSFFKDAMLFQTGFDLYWISEYRGYRYFPESNRFYLNNINNQLGEHYQIDFFINARIDKNFKLGLKMENLTGENFDQFRIQDYPIPSRVYKISLSWALIN